MSVEKNVTVLFNPSSGKGKAFKEKDKIERILITHHIDYDFFISESEAHLKELVADAIARPSKKHTDRIIVAVGGDTTFNIVAREILTLSLPHESPALGMIGAGSANDIVRGLNISRVHDACIAIKNGSTSHMDIGYLKIKKKGENYFRTLNFLGTLSAGLGTTVNRYIDSYYRQYPILSKLIPFSQLLTGLFGIYHSFSKKKLPIRMKMQILDAGAEISGNISDPKHIEKVIKEIQFSLLVFLNTPFYANGLKLAKDGSLFDGQLDCCIIQSHSFFDTIKTGLSIRKGNSTLSTENKSVQIIPSSQSDIIRLIPEQPFDIQIDGDIIEEVVELEVSILPGKLKVICPSFQK